MKVAMMQPSFLPWLGYFELIAKADKFIFLDDFQFVYQSYHQRNSFFINKGQVGWYVVPVDKKNGFLKPLNQVKIREDLPWRDKIWRRIVANYAGTPYYEFIEKDLKKLIMTPSLHLAAENLKFIKYFCKILEYNKEFIYSSNLHITTKRSRAVLDILSMTKASSYLCACGSFEYMKEDRLFPTDTVEVFFQNYIPKIYPQLGSQEDKFVPFLSILDALMNVGPLRTRTLIENGTEIWQTWHDKMKEAELIEK